MEEGEGMVGEVEEGIEAGMTAGVEEDMEVAAEAGDMEAEVKAELSRTCQEGGNCSSQLPFGLDR